MRRVMLDIETVSTRMIAGMVAVGIALYDDAVPEHVTARGWFIDPEFITGHRDQDTMDWWDKQDVYVREQVFSGNQTQVEIMSSIRSFMVANQLVGDRNVLYYADPANFDFPIIRNQFNLANIECPWAWHQERCSRTMRKVLDHEVGIKFIESPNLMPHHPVHDAITQLKDLKILLNLYAGLRHPDVTE